ncbi:MAG: tRNA (adenosine(37)-N6)-dimethylallyltransferase MiaA [Firmicutes bacterium]|nr:tRNA (adenosine(37)-N6)-dimethylallyltransferase MiaA [Bacillota bacterium]
MSNEKIIVIAGPTAVGKTDVAIGVARALGTEIVSCDSMQLYKYMDIGSAKPTAEERALAKHHLVDIIDPREPFSVAVYRDMADECISEITARGMTPIVSGGTGLYLDSLLYDLDFGGDEGADDERREQLYAFVEEHGNEALFDKLRSLDPSAAERIHPNNVKRVIRAIEAAEKGEPLSSFEGVSDREMRREAVLIGLKRDRQQLYDRIDRRVDIMMDNGLADEVRGLLDMGMSSSDISMKGIGYKELLDCFSGLYDEEEAVRLIKRNSRRYAKRQMTWFNRYKTMEWFDIGEYNDTDEVTEVIVKWLKERS